MRYFTRQDGDVYKGEEPVYGDEVESTQTEIDAFEAARTVARRKVDINIRLNQIDMESIRSVRAIQSGTSTQADVDKLSILETEVASLRTELGTL